MVCGTKTERDSQSPGEIRKKTRSEGEVHRKYSKGEERRRGDRWDETEVGGSYGEFPRN